MNRRRPSRWRRRRTQTRAVRNVIQPTPKPIHSKTQQNNLVTQALIEETAQKCSEKALNKIRRMVEAKVSESSTDRSSIKESIKCATNMLQATVDRVNQLKAEVDSSTQNQIIKTETLIRENAKMLTSRMNQRIETTQTSLKSLSRRSQETDSKFEHFRHQLIDMKQYVSNANRSDIQVHVVARCAVDVFSIDPIEVNEPVEPLRALRIYPGEVCTLLLKPETVGNNSKDKTTPLNKRFVRCVRLASSRNTSAAKKVLPVPVIVYVEYISSNFENVRLTTPAQTIQSSIGNTTASKKLTL